MIIIMTSEDIDIACQNQAKNMKDIEVLLSTIHCTVSYCFVKYREGTNGIFTTLALTVLFLT